MNNNIKRRNYKNSSFFLSYFLIFTFLFILHNSLVHASLNDFEKIHGPDIKNNEIVVKKGIGEYSFKIDEDKFPKSVNWTWKGKGEVYLCVQYSDKNTIYYLMGDSQVPKVENITFIDSKGVPTIIAPKIFSMSEGKVTLDFINAYYKYYGKKNVNVEKVFLKINTKNSVRISDFNVLEYKDKFNEDKDSLIHLDSNQKKLYLEMQMPQGNRKDHYMLNGENLPIEVILRALADKDTKGYLKLTFPEGMQIISCNNKNIKFINKNTISLPINAVRGYNEEKIIIMANLRETGSFNVEAMLDDEVTKISKNVKAIDVEKVKNEISLLEEGVYPIQHSKGDTVLKKELKNNIKVKQNVFDWVHRIIGSGEEHDAPAGLASGVFKNSGEFDIPLHVKFSVLDENDREIVYFRGEHFDKEEEQKSVPETNIVVKSGKSLDLKMPVFADTYSVKPGKYKGQMKVSFFGSDSELIIREFPLQVHKESQFQEIIGVVAFTLSVVCLILLYVKQKKWTKGLRSSEVMLIALFTTVKFALVDVSWFVMGDVIRALLGPLGPFMHIVTGIFWDIINSLFLVTLLSLVTKPGVVIISTIVRLILKGVAFGTFNPVAILLMMSYSVIAEGLLYVAGFTSGKRELDSKIRVFIRLAIIFGIQNCYSTYTFYYIWMYLYRMFYPAWYININAIFSVVYSIVGSISGVYLGKKLKKVID